MKVWLPLLLIAFCCSSALQAEDDGPVLSEGFVVDTVAKEPMVSNPCVMAFDRYGRICVAQGPQWRGPTPETPGDRVDILIDNDGDGIAEDIQTFADGFNSIQGIAWHGNDLWVANAPDLTVVRDTDGDDKADQYLRVYTGLGNLEHSLHGLNIGPDGKLYMSKGNSKGYNRLDQLAPLPFRELWGLPSPAGAPDYTPVEETSREDYRRKYHTPQDDWGQTGGILRCDPRNADGEYGRNLEIFSRGFRNPWDISFDDQFNWLGTDNDQTEGDKIFAPFNGAHFGWGHPWSFHWTGKDHLPSVPASAPLFEGSGTGVIHYHASQFPAEYRDLFFVNDWMRREIYMFRPEWDGALMKCVDETPAVFAHAQSGRTAPGSSGRVFEPTDIEVGPDGALYVLSWGHGYGGILEKGKQTDAGRVYRIRYAGNPLTEWEQFNRHIPMQEWPLSQLLSDLGSDVPAWRVNAQEELLQRGDIASQFLREQLENGQLTTAQETWTLWTLGRFASVPGLSEQLAKLADDESKSLNQRIQAVRILAFRARRSGNPDSLPDTVLTLLTHESPRLRHAAVQAIWQSKRSQWVDALRDLAAQEQDRIVFYSIWNALRDLASADERKTWLTDDRTGVRLAAALSLFQDDEATADDVAELRADPDQQVARLVNDWLIKTGKAAPIVRFDPPAGEYANSVTVTLNPAYSDGFLTYTLDGSQPTYTSARVNGPINLNRSSTIRVAVNRGNTGGSLFAKAEYEIRHVEPYRHREFVSQVSTPSGRSHELDWTGLAPGKRHYTDRDYHILKVSPELAGLPFLRVANNDDRSTGDEWLSFELSEPCDVLVGVDSRNPMDLSWMKIGDPDGFHETDLQLATTDPVFRIYRKHFPAGKVTLGGNTNFPQTDSGRGNYTVIFDRAIIDSAGNDIEATVDEVLARMADADPERGRELFLHPRGAGCFKCHRMEGQGAVLAPDLSDIGTRVKDPRVLVESILHPSRVITEGFAQQQVVTTGGKVYSGAVVEETGQSLKLVGSDAVVHIINKEDIEERIGSKLSPMPAGFGKLMTAQQTADVVAWLMTQKQIGDRDGFSFQDRPDRIDVLFQNQRIATYLKKHPQLTRRALVNVMTPSGLPVTRNFPPRKPEDIDPGYGAEDGIIHPVMHPGIWIGFGDVNGNDFWRLQADAVFDGLTAPPTGERTSGQFSVRNRLMNEAGDQLVCNETTRFQFQRVPQGILLKIDAEYLSNERDFYFGDQEESGLAVRVASPIRVQGGNGEIINNRGEKNGAQVWGKQADWFDYSGVVAGQRIGVLVVPSPENPRPSWLHARDYGVVVTNPFPKQPRERREPYVKTWVKRGQPFRLSYAVLIHDQPADAPWDREQVAQDILATFETP